MNGVYCQRGHGRRRCHWAPDRKLYICDQCGEEYADEEINKALGYEPQIPELAHAIAVGTDIRTLPILIEYPR
jgi:hypothetical protein